MRGADQARTGRARQLRHVQAERRLWMRLRNRQLRGYKFVRQEPIGPSFADSCCRERCLTVELDGSQHAESARDALRDAYLAREGYRVLRFWNPEVFSNMSGVIQNILAELHPATPPHPRRSGLPQPRQGDFGPLLPTPGRSSRGER